MKYHDGVDAGSGLVYTITVTAAIEHDITQTVNLLREDDEEVYGDSGYLGVQKRPEIENNEHTSKRLISASNAVPAVFPRPVTTLSTRNGILRIVNPRCAAKWSMHSGSSSVSSATGKQCIGD